MMDKRLFGLVPGSVKYIVMTVVMQWILLLSNVLFMYAFAVLLTALYRGTAGTYVFLIAGASALGAFFARILFTYLIGRTRFLASKSVKITLRTKIYEKLLRLGTSYRESVNTAELLQAAGEGVDQLETYFGNYLPQFFYAVLAPVTLFFIVMRFDLKAALILLIFVPLIPISIALVQTFAKKLLSKYWGRYTKLGDTFLENLQGLTTLKIYQADERQHALMNEQAELFRKATMSVLRMQLNSISVMDIVAYGGAAAGMIAAVLDYRAGNVSLTGCILIILLSADFFLPMRQLGSYFHVAMNGMAASDRIFDFLALEEKEDGKAADLNHGDIVLDHITFRYGEREVLSDISLVIKENELTAIAGESGSGKSTLAKLITRKETGYEGSITINGIEVGDIAQSALMKHCVYVSDHAYVFAGTVRENLMSAKPDADDEEMNEALEQAGLAGELSLDDEIMERASNISGGQRQRLALARALLSSASVYILDEATSSIDAESEEKMMNLIQKMKGEKTVLLISHRLENVKNADRIYVLDEGKLVEEGTHDFLVQKNGLYEKLYRTQTELEALGGEA